MPKSNSYGIRDMYLIFQKDNPELDVPYDLFKEIINEHNKLALEKVLEGETFHFGKGLSSIFVKRFKRVFKIDDEGKVKGTKIDHNETRKLKAQGINKVVYHTSPYYFRMLWQKKYCNVPGKSAYCFQLTKGKNGAKTKFAAVLRNPINHLRFTDEHNK